MDDLLKDAIADAKAVRETALANAKIALEEAFTPRLQSMLSKKIAAEMEPRKKSPFQASPGHYFPPPGCRDTAPPKNRLAECPRAP